MAEIFWHNIDASEALNVLRGHLSVGLSTKEVETRQKEFGKNKLAEAKSLSGLRIFLEQFQSPLVYILIIAGVLTVALGAYTDSIVIFGAVLLNTFVGFIQEKKASQTLRELQKVVLHEARVLREGNLKIVNSEELVPGDIFVLNPGDRAPADGRLLETHDLKINEMALTGEWLAASKNYRPLEKETPLADRDNMIYMGTVVENGRGRAVVTETGANTQIGKVALLVREAKEEKTPYQKKLGRFAKTVGFIIAVISAAIFLEGVLTGGEIFEMFLTAVAVAVAAIPEGLPVAIAVILAIGMQRILRQKGLVRKLASAETLGSTSIICTDKTATLTEGVMKTDKIIPTEEITEARDADENQYRVILAAMVCSEAFIENPEALAEKWILRGRPTDRALLQTGIQTGINYYEVSDNRVARLPFNSNNKFSAAVYQNHGQTILYFCGAPEDILQRSSANHNAREKLEAKLDELAAKGLRLVATAEKPIGQDELDKVRQDGHALIEKLCQNAYLTGFITLKDPVRKEVAQAIRIAQEAGIKPVIVTGDHKLTTKAIAEEIGLKITEDEILTGAELDRLSDAEFTKILPEIKIYARVEPEHKMRIVGAWQARGEVVAMTGDGINDAPALKQADIGIALGSGTEVAKETSDLVLLNDSFSIIVAAIEEGRAIIDNIKKVITYLFSSAFTEVLLVGLSVFAGWPLPILAVQILWINLIEDGPLSLALSFEPKEEGLMRQKPVRHDAPLLDNEMKVLIFAIGLITDLILVGLFIWLLNFSGYPIPHIRSVLFAGLAIDSIFYIFAFKSLRRNIWQTNPFSNRFLVLAWLFAVIFLVAGLYFPPFQILLKTEPLSLFDWQLVLGLGLLNIILIEATKYYFIVRHKTA